MLVGDKGAVRDAGDFGKDRDAHLLRPRADADGNGVALHVHDQRVAAGALLHPRRAVLFPVEHVGEGPPRRPALVVRLRGKDVHLGTGTVVLREHHDVARRRRQRDRHACRRCEHHHAALGEAARGAQGLTVHGVRHSGPPGVIGLAQLCAERVALGVVRQELDFRQRVARRVRPGRELLRVVDRTLKTGRVSLAGRLAGVADQRDLRLRRGLLRGDRRQEAEQGKSGPCEGHTTRPAAGRAGVGTRSACEVCRWALGASQRTFTARAGDHAVVGVIPHVVSPRGRARQPRVRADGHLEPGPRRLTPPRSPPYRTRCCSTISCHPPVPPFLRFDRRPGGHDRVKRTPRPAGSRSKSPPLTRGAVARTFLFCDV